MKFLLKSLFFIIICYQPLAAQKIFTKDRLLNRETHDLRVLRWGYYLGFNSLDYFTNYKSDVANLAYELQDVKVIKETGFNIGLIGNLRLGNHLDLRLEPGVVFSSRDLVFLNVLDPTNQLRRSETTAVHIPLLLKFSTKRLNNFKPFVVAGFSNTINLASNEDNPEDNLTSFDFRTKASYFNYELGFGIDFFLPYFKFTPTIRGVFSLTNELVPDNDAANSPYTSHIESMKTRGVFINFTFQ